jgi:hypothetical protein
VQANACVCCRLSSAWSNAITTKPGRMIQCSHHRFIVSVRSTAIVFPRLNGGTSKKDSFLKPSSCPPVLLYSESSTPQAMKSFFFKIGVVDPPTSPPRCLLLPLRLRRRLNQTTHPPLSFYILPLGHRVQRRSVDAAVRADTGQERSVTGSNKGVRSGSGA